MDSAEGLRSYEGLVYTTSHMYARACGMEQDDLAQLLWIKIWQARAKFDGSRSKMDEQGFVYGCMKNRVKDLIRNHIRQVRREGPPPLPMAEGESGEMFLGSVPIFRERFEERYLAVGSEQVFGEIDEGPFMLPATLDGEEAQVVVLLMEGYTQKDIADVMGVGLKRVKSWRVSIETKLADWAPVQATMPAPALRTKRQAIAA